jgi:hypothetical protein
VTTGCSRRRVAPATLNCTSSRSAGRSQARRQPARSRARTLDGELALRLSTQACDTQLNYQPADLTACQGKSHLLHLSWARATECTPPAAGLPWSRAGRRQAALTAPLVRTLRRNWESEKDSS